jgi:hypothetical protein
MLYNLNEVKEELLNDIKNNNLNISNFDDRVHEYADSAVPVYHCDIIKGWQNLPPEYWDTAEDHFGDQNCSVINLMIGDIYLYYIDLYNKAMEELKACTHSGDFLGVTCVKCNLLVGNCCGVVDDSDQTICINCI